MKKSIVLLWKKYRAIIGIFLLFLILLGFLSSRAYFSRRDELKSFQIVVGNLVYQLSSSEFSSDNKVKISSGETKLFTIDTLELFVSFR